MSIELGAALVAEAEVRFDKASAADEDAAAENYAHCLTETSTFECDTLEDVLIKQRAIGALPFNSICAGLQGMSREEALLVHSVLRDLQRLDAHQA
jgi:hypothetical protein